MYYETEFMSIDKARKFRNWFKDEIGTDYDRNKTGNLIYFVLCDLIGSEVKQIRQWELNNETK